MDFQPLPDAVLQPTIAPKRGKLLLMCCQRQETFGTAKRPSRLCPILNPPIMRAPKTRNNRVADGKGFGRRFA